MANQFKFDKSIVEDNIAKTVEKINYYAACKARLNNIIEENDDKLQGEAMKNLKDELLQVSDVVDEQIAAIKVLMDKMEQYCSCMSQANDELEEQLKCILGGE